MQGHQRFARSVVAVIVVVVGLLIAVMIPVAQAGSGNPNPRVLPVHSNAYGNTYGEWSARWWQWLLSIPAATNPNFDTTGAHCAEGQAGKVWFLAGTFGVDINGFPIGPVTRSCTVPHGKALFFSFLNTVFGAAAGDCDPSNPGVLCDVPALRASASAAEDNPMALAVSIDGVALQNLSDYRVQSPVFSLTLPKDNVFETLGLDTPSGTYAPQVSDGYWLMLAPLSAGAHTIHFKAKSNSGFELDVTYDLTVGP